MFAKVKSAASKSDPSTVALAQHKIRQTSLHPSESESWAAYSKKEALRRFAFLKFVSRTILCYVRFRHIEHSIRVEGDGWKKRGEEPTWKETPCIS